MSPEISTISGFCVVAIAECDTKQSITSTNQLSTTRSSISLQKWRECEALWPRLVYLNFRVPLFSYSLKAQLYKMWRTCGRLMEQHNDWMTHIISYIFQNEIMHFNRIYLKHVRSLTLYLCWRTPLCFLLVSNKPTDLSQSGICMQFVG